MNIYTRADFKGRNSKADNQAMTFMFLDSLKSFPKYYLTQ